MPRVSHPAAWRFPIWLVLATTFGSLAAIAIALGAGIKAAGALKVSVPASPMRSSKLIDGVVWDGKDPAKYADSFKIKA